MGALLGQGFGSPALAGAGAMGGSVSNSTVSSSELHLHVLGDARANDAPETARLLARMGLIDERSLTR